MWHRTFLLMLVVLSLSVVVTASAHAQSTPSVGSVIINEIMYDSKPLESSREWVELKNVTTATVSLENCAISDADNHSHTFSSSALIASGDYFVVGIDGSHSWVDYDYGGSITLNNTGDTIAIRCGTTTIDSVTYDVGTNNWPTNSDGVSVAFTKPIGSMQPESDNDNGTNWYLSTASCCGGAENGTPGTKNADAPTAVTLRTLTAIGDADTLVPLSRKLLSVFGLVAVGAGLTILKRRRPI